MSELYLPRTLIVIQVIFGRPLRGRREFRSGDIEDLTITQLGPANYSKTLNRLVELGWVRSTVRRQTRRTGRGRPSEYVYSRTEYGRQEYQKLAADLAQFGIKLT